MTHRILELMLEDARFGDPGGLRTHSPGGSKHGDGEPWLDKHVRKLKREQRLQNFEGLN